MKSRVRLLGHPLHPMLIVFPLGLLGMAPIFDLIGLIRHETRWSEVAFWLIGAGIITGLLAAVFGLIDWTAIPWRTRAKTIGLLHGGSNVVAVALFAISWWLRRGHSGGSGNAAIVVGWIGLCVALLGGWLGGELVDRLGVGVDEGAHLDSPSSLSGRPASESVHNTPRTV